VHQTEGGTPQRLVQWRCRFGNRTNQEDIHKVWVEPTARLGGDESLYVPSNQVDGARKLKLQTNNINSKKGKTLSENNGVCC